MSSTLLRWVARVAFVAASLAASRELRAQDEPTAARGASASAERDGSRSPRRSQDDTRRPITLTMNPLAFAMQRYGGNIEVSPWAHHAFVGSAYVQSIPLGAVKTVVGQDEIRNDGGSSFGGELGYRFYTGGSGADGLFFGPSFVTMPLAYPRVADDFAAVDLRRFTATGAAFDVGVQKILEPGLTLGVGVGVMYLAYSLPEDNRRLLASLEPHVLPRLLLTAGWSF